MKKIAEFIESGEPLLLDGAMGTELYNHGIFINRCFDEANLTSPQLVREILCSYRTAGAQVLTTNSWGSNRFKLQQHNLGDQVEKINVAAARIAREVAGDDLFVAGSMGPLGVELEPFGPTAFAEAQEAFMEQLMALQKGGIDLISLETFTDIRELQQAIKAVKTVAPDLPVMAQLVIDPSGKLSLGSSIEWAMAQLDQWGADIIGLNCSVGPGPMLSAVEQIRKVSSKPLVMQPNAGLPRQIEGRMVYMCTPEYMAEHAKNFLQAGVQFVGGCCGTGPEHIKAMAAAMRHGRAMAQSSLRSKGGEESQPAALQAPQELPRVKPEDKSSWAAKIARQEMVYTLELLPPPGVNPDQLLEKAAAVKAAGVDCINIPDGPRASARMSAMLTSLLIQQRVGIETILHYTCRDRNLLGMQSDMLGAHAVGLRNLLLVTGDPPKLGDYPDATGVFDVDAIGLTNMVNQLNGGIDLGHRVMREPSALSIGVGVNPVHRDFDYEMKRFRYKVEAGAEWAITQPVFDVAAMERFLDYIEAENLRIPIIAGIWPLVSLRNATFMNNEVPGVVIPPDIIERMADHSDPEKAKREGVAIAREMVEALGNRIQGVQVSAPFGRIDLALEVIGKA